jgi:hypothetical protein
MRKGDEPLKAAIDDALAGMRKGRRTRRSAQVGAVGRPPGSEEIAGVEIKRRDFDVDAMPSSSAPH